MTIKKEPDDNIYCHQAPGYSAKIVKTIPYSIHIEKNNQEQYSIIRKRRKVKIFPDKSLRTSDFIENK